MTSRNSNIIKAMKDYKSLQKEIHKTVDRRPEDLDVSMGEIDLALTILKQLRAQSPDIYDRAIKMLDED